MAQEEKISKFLEAITKDALHRKEQILSEIDDYNKRELEKAEDEALAEAYAMIQSEIVNTRETLQRELCVQETQQRKAVFAKRTEITDEVFDRVAHKLNEFTRTQAYEEWFFGELGQAVSQLGCENPQIEIRANDAAFTDKIKKAVPCGCTVKTDGTFKIGGFRWIDGVRGIIADCTLDSKLREEKERFFEKSGLSIVW